MPKYRLLASYGFAGTDTEFGVLEFETEEDASKCAWDCACERVDAWVELVEDDDE